MQIKKIYGAANAAEYAATLNDEWKTSAGDIITADVLIDFGAMADDESGYTDEECGDDDDYAYYVDENGAMGFSYDGGVTVNWEYVPTHPAVTFQQPAFCSGCGNPIEPDWAFCRNCGNKLK